MLVLGKPHKKCPNRRSGRGRGRRRRRRKLKAKCKAKAAVRGKTGDKDKVNYSAPYTQPNASSTQFTHPTPHTPDPCAHVCCDFRAEFPLGSDVEKRCAAAADIAWLALTWLVFVLPHRDMCNTPGHTYMCTYAIQFSSVYFTARRSQHQLSLPCPALLCPPLPCPANSPLCHPSNSSELTIRTHTHTRTLFCLYLDCITKQIAEKLAADLGII